MEQHQKMYQLGAPVMQDRRQCRRADVKGHGVGTSRGMYQLIAPVGDDWKERRRARV